LGTLCFAQPTIEVACADIAVQNETPAFIMLAFFIQDHRQQLVIKGEGA
jgi:hypothetical protein